MQCRETMSEATVWANLHWLTERKILVQKFDGRINYFGLNPEMPPDSAKGYDRILDVCAGYS